MADEELIPHTSPFDAIRHVDEAGNEYWSAREIYRILGYTEWRNFNNTVIKRAKKACEENGQGFFVRGGLSRGEKTPVPTSIFLLFPWNRFSVGEREFYSGLSLR